MLEGANCRNSNPKEAFQQFARPRGIATRPRTKLDRFSLDRKSHFPVYTDERIMYELDLSVVLPQRPAESNFI